MSRFGFVGSILIFLPAFASLVYATALLAPAIVFQVATLDARLLARNWLSSMQQQFDLPGDPLPFQTNFADRMATVLLQQSGFTSNEIDIFRPVDFQSLKHFGQIGGYTVFTNFGELFIAGGVPKLRSFDEPAFAQAAQRAMTLRQTVVYRGQAPDMDAGQISVVLIPLYKVAAPRGVVSIEIERNQIEGVMERGVQFASMLTAGI